MKNHIPVRLLLLLIPILIVKGAVTCFSGDHRHGGVNAIIKQATENLAQSGENKFSISVPKNTVKAKLNYQGGQFFTEKRRNYIQRFRCSSCHNNKDVKIKNAERISHADIKVTHGGKDRPLTCYTCHSRKERDFLNTSKNNRIDIDHVYEMCGECHFRQKKDWIGGAHGKRMTYWAGDRVIKNCTSCHNPHSPRFEKRWPATYSAPFN